MSNLANNHNKVSSSHCAQSAGNEKEKFYFINLGNETLWDNHVKYTVLIIQEQLDFVHKICSFKHDPKQTLFVP